MKMKNLWKRGAAALLALVLALGMTACGGKDGGGDGDAASAMLSARESMKKVTSMSYTYSMEMSMQAEGQTVEMKVDGTADMTMDPVAVKMTMNMNMLGMSLTGIELYMVQEGSQVVTYTGMDLFGQGEKTWTKTTGGDSDAGVSMEQYNAKDSFDLYLKNGANFKATGTETVQGAAATRYEGVIAKDMLKDTLEQSGSMDQLDGMVDANIDDVLKKIGDIPVTMWLDNETGLPVKYVIDMTNLLVSMVEMAAENSGESTDVSADKFVMTMEVTKYNGVDEIKVPQDVLDSAAEIEG